MIAKKKPLLSVKATPVANPDRLHLATEGGFTLIEIMVAMVAAGIVLTSVFSFAAVQKKLASEHQHELRVDQSLDGAMWAIGRDLQMAGLGITRTCSELRIWDQANNRLLNPGALQKSSELASVPLDNLSEEPFWVLRDGLQAHWRSHGVNKLVTTSKFSSDANSAADSFDVMMGEGNYASASGIFRIDVSSWASGGLRTGTDAVLILKSFNGTSKAVSGGAPSAELKSDDEKHLQAAQHLFRPGSFVVVSAIGEKDAAFRPVHLSQCALLQVTGSLKKGASSNEWHLPISSDSSFNANLENLLGLPDADEKYKPRTIADGGTGDWQSDKLQKLTLVPMGNFRWSRYEIDYSIQNRPYLVRTDIIGWRRGDKHFSSGGVDYPGCRSSKCPAPLLRLPGESNANAGAPPRQAIAVNIEDMQVAVGCDGYARESVDHMLKTYVKMSHPRMIPYPDVGFEEKFDDDIGPNLLVDESPDLKGRKKDEWLGNAPGEEWAPDCVYYGSAERYQQTWVNDVKSEGRAGPGFRMSPQEIRVTLVSRHHNRSALGRGATADYSKLPALEDRASMESPVKGYGVQLRSERFSPRNLRWRDDSFR